MVDSIITSPCTWQTVSDIINSRSTGGGRTMFFPVLPTAPTTPVSGQVYFDETLGKPRIYDGTNWVDFDGTGGAAGVVLPRYATAPTAPVPGLMYFDTALGRPRVWDGTQWVDDSNAGGVVFPRSATAPSTPVAGQSYIETGSGLLKTYDGAAWQNLGSLIDWADLQNRPPLYYTGPFADSTNIVINHKMKKYPSVRVVDTGGTEWAFPQQIIYTDLDNIVVKFSFLFGGTIWLA